VSQCLVETRVFAFSNPDSFMMILVLDTEQIYYHGNVVRNSQWKNHKSNFKLISMIEILIQKAFKRKARCNLII